MTRVPAFQPELATPGETQTQQRDRSRRNKQRREEWFRFMEQRCSRCGLARINVRHETDPATSPEGPAYYADMLDELHEFAP